MGSMSDPSNVEYYVTSLIKKEEELEESESKAIVEGQKGQIKYNNNTYNGDVYSVEPPAENPVRILSATAVLYYSRPCYADQGAPNDDKVHDG